MQIYEWEVTSVMSVCLQPGLIYNWMLKNIKSLPVQWEYLICFFKQERKRQVAARGSRMMKQKQDKTERNFNTRLQPEMTSLKGDFCSNLCYLNVCLCCALCPRPNEWCHSALLRTLTSLWWRHSLREWKRSLKRLFKQLERRRWNRRRSERGVFVRVVLYMLQDEVYFLKLSLDTWTTHRII